MVQEVVKTGNDISRNTGINKQTDITGKDILEGIELFEKVEELANKLELEEDKKLSIPGLIGYYVLLCGKKIAYFSYRKVNGKIELVNFGTSNAKNYLEEIEKESQLLSEKMKNLDDVDKIPFLGISSLLRFIYLIKDKKESTLFFTPSLFSIRKGFYSKSLDLFQEQGIINWEKSKREYVVNFKK